MERDSLIGHGIASFIKESMMERSDKHYAWISEKSGLLSIVNPAKNIYSDYSVDDTSIYIDVNKKINKRYVLK